MANPGSMRDLVVREALESLAQDAGEALRGAVAEGAEVPYEVVEEGGTGTALYRYRQLVEPFVRSHLHLVRRLGSYGPARSVLEAAGVAEPYLTYRGVEIPEQQAASLDEALVRFLGRLWEESSDFELDADRFEAVLAELEESVGSAARDVELVCPVLGLRMEPERVRVGEVALVTAGGVDVPPEARRLEGSRAAGWEPHAVAWTSVEPEGADQASPVGLALQRLRRTITLLRLFAPGSVALGPHAWTRVGRGEWRCVPTGEGAPRPGGYILEEDGWRELAALGAALETRSLREGELSWALGRFESGCARRSALDGLTDHLLALRALLEGGGPAEIGLALRVAALCAEPKQRGEVKADVDGAIALEGSVIRGEVDAEQRGGGGAVKLAASIESLLRAILRDALTGHLGHDLRATADEVLLADGLASTFGDGEPSGRPRLHRAGPRDGGEAPEDLEDSPEPSEEHEQWGGLRLPRPPATGATHPSGAGEDWFEGTGPETLDFPAVDRVERRRARQSRDGDTAERVRHLFPVPETTEWQVAEDPLARSAGSVAVLERVSDEVERVSDEAHGEDEAPEAPVEEPEPFQAPESFATPEPTVEHPDDTDEDPDLWSAPV